MTRLLVTGATGGFAKHLVRHWRAQDGVTVLTTSRTHSEPESNEFFCDFGVSGQFTHVLERSTPDCVVHLAADFGDEIAAAHRINFASALELLQWAESATTKPRVLLMGTAAEYGCVTPEENPIDEARALAPVSVYGMSKACQSQLVKLYAMRGVDVLCARLFNLRGENLSKRMFVGKIAEQIGQVKAGTRTHIEVGSLSAARDFIHVDDAIKQLLAILQFGNAGEIYHVASGKALTMRELLLEELAVNGLPWTIVREAPVFSNRTGFDVPMIYANIEKTMQLMKSNTNG